ncbi:MAG: flavodoxin [Hungatella sp.]|jgi:flavodoxin short chain|uniref:Flavodoxin n=1 Tax=Lacrimispora sp. BS-2 TaxID=3151850 RepID=A0AAU7PNN4_9FIRM|nr:flavodoxin [Hungatella sp.]MDR1770020.1 flavodoxin [Hungatella sp.]MDR2022724.1 flavodoxin [Hungatella sp.]
MSKIAVVYWSGTGNTEAMAAAVLEGVKEKGAEGVVLTPSEFDASMIDSFDAIAFGCPAMGAEVLEESEFDPMFTACLSKLGGKKVALFGSYGWGDGEWMRSWESTCEDAGVKLVCDSVICNEAPDGEATAACKALGAALAE